MSPLDLPILDWEVPDRGLHPDLSVQPLPALGNLTLVVNLGKGGMGIVYLAERQDGGEQVALKTVSVPDARLLQSIRLARAVAAKPACGSSGTRARGAAGQLHPGQQPPQR